METKVCKICGKEKNIQEFNKCFKRKCRRAECKECQKAKYKEYYKQNKDLINSKHKEYVCEHKSQYKQYAQKCYIKHKAKRNKQNKEYYLKNIEKAKEYNKNYYLLNKEKIISNVKMYRKNNKQELIKKQEIYNNTRRQNDKLFKLKTNIRNTINRSFVRKEYQKNKKTEEILCCNIDFFIKYLLKTFKDNYGYDWDGVEKVHIDHIKPLKFANTEEEIIQLCHYTNLQLLKKHDNLKKGYKTNYKVEREE